jgi:hypothetical protein
MAGNPIHPLDHEVSMQNNPHGARNWLDGIPQVRIGCQKSVLSIECF